jgi:hypothetical protein
MSQNTVLQMPGLIMVLALAVFVLAAGLVSDMMLGVVVVVPFLVCVWWVRNLHLTVLHEAVQSNTRKHKLSTVQNKES